MTEPTATTRLESRWTLANDNTTGGMMEHPLDPRDRFDPLAYDAAYHALTGRYNGDIAEMAKRVTVAACELWETYNPAFGADVKQYANDADRRTPVVIGLLAAASPTEWRHTRPLLDAALAAATKALWDAPDAVRYGYPLPDWSDA